MKWVPKPAPTKLWLPGGKPSDCTRMFVVKRDGQKLWPPSDTYGKLDICVNNASIAVLVPIEEMTLEQWNRQIEVNLTSVFLGCKAAIAAMKQGDGGSIINLSSVAGLIGLQSCVAYGAAKGGVRIMSKSIAVEAAK